ncbi:hypothetical protein [Amycolatopsis keratiniphila]|uniref:hypothetical protein n=1 Tax=Amycolatopsis keratiniphila TaxID=129921 RepID=UPI00087C5E37|nr:hypothetical protein [Amycolatopsis keratiniphila]OLZ56163.1 hypothetical protein BS330_18795 [Amycolatopsis keratiniphila subsp. nogabecina]SDU52210.1 hypothetical protein SAMN04489733_5422 [Amycolatopsis keratiniphila]
MAVPEGTPVYQPGFDPGSVCKAPPTGGSYGTPVAEGAGFKYDEATLHELATEWRDLALQYQADLAEAGKIARARPPGLEYASGNNADITKLSGAALEGALRQRIAYCENMANKYMTALGKYATAEEHATSVINQQPKGIA